MRASRPARRPAGLLAARACKRTSELLYDRFTSKDQTSILARVLQGNVELGAQTLEFQGFLGFPMKKAGNEQEAWSISMIF